MPVIGIQKWISDRGKSSTKRKCTYGQIKMLLTHLGWHSTMVLTGDPDQTDLLPGMSGLSDIAHRLSVLPEVAVVYLTDRDIVRHPLVGAMLTVL